jgi:hypothetical protein
MVFKNACIGDLLVGILNLLLCRTTRSDLYSAALGVFAFAAVLGIFQDRWVVAAVITNGPLEVAISDSNGAIASVTFGGAEYFRHGTFVSDFGFQNGTDTGSFVYNSAAGFGSQPVVVMGTTVTGNYTNGGANVAFQRTYSLVGGLNVLRISTQLSNQGVSATTLSYFDGFDPDQGESLGLGFGTFNDVFGLAGASVAEARVSSNDTVVMGSTDPRVTVSSGNIFAIGSGSELNSFFDAPFDPNGAFDDSGTQLGLRVLLAPGQSTSVTYDLAFGLNSTDARNAFAAAQVPEPGSLVIFGLGSAIYGIGRRRRSAC